MRGQVKKDPNTNLTIGIFKPSRLLNKKIFKKYLYVIMSLLIVAGLVFAIDQFVVNRNKHAANNAFASMKSKVDPLFKKGNYASAKPLLLLYTKSYPNDNNKSHVRFLSSDLSTIYLSQADYTDAKTWLQKLISVEANAPYSDYEYVAIADRQLKNYSEAIKYYKLALNAFKNDTAASGQPTSSITEHSLTDQINTLEKQKQ